MTTGTIRTITALSQRGVAVSASTRAWTEAASDLHGTVVLKSGVPHSWVAWETAPRSTLSLSIYSLKTPYFFLRMLLLLIIKGLRP